MSTSPVTLPARHINLRPVRKSYSAPAVTKDELALAVQMIAGMYEPLAPHADDLEEWASKSRQAAYAVVQFGWTLAKVEAEIGDRRWFRTEWCPQMKEAQANGEAMPENLHEGSPVRMGRSERDLLISAVGPMFCPADEANEAIREMVPGTVIGKRGTHVRAALKLVELVLGEDGYKEFEESLKAARVQDATSPAPEADAQEESDEDAPEADAEETEAPAAEEPAAEAKSA